MCYCVIENVNLFFKVYVIVNEVGKIKVEYSIGVCVNFGFKFFVINVIVCILILFNMVRIMEWCIQGKVKYELLENNIVWKIGCFIGQSEFVLSVEVELISMIN